MTREEAKHPSDYGIKTGQHLDFKNKRSFNDYLKHIDEIYDHFEQQQLENLAHLQMANSLIEKFQSRKCESCKYYSHSHHIFEHSCHLLSMSNQPTPVPDNFGCNKWEAKDAN